MCQVGDTLLCVNDTQLPTQEGFKRDVQLAREASAAGPCTLILSRKAPDCQNTHKYRIRVNGERYECFLFIALRPKYCYCICEAWCKLSEG
jgi:hypothetical protein